MDLSATFLRHFASLKDPRLKNHNHRHYLTDILAITVLGTICGADGWVEIVDFARAKKEWLKTFLKLPNGIPSHDTFGRVFSLLDPQMFFECFLEWVQSLNLSLSNEVIAFDGKTLRGSHNRKKGKQPLHLVSAWASNQQILLGQIKTEDKSNEITAIPQLLKMIDVKDAIVTIDAMGCQKKIAKQIIKQGGNYVLSLKDNQPTLRQDVASIFAKGTERQFKKMLHRRVRKKDHGHGRIDTRVYTLISAREELEFKRRWPGLSGIGKIESTRNINNVIETEVRYFLTSLSYEKIDDFARAARQHWGVENNLHWSLDVSFKEDLSRIRIGYAAENLATVRRIALNLVKHEKTRKAGIACSRKRAGWDNEYLMKVLMTTPVFDGK